MIEYINYLYGIVTISPMLFIICGPIILIVLGYMACAFWVWTVGLLVCLWLIGVDLSIIIVIGFLCSMGCIKLFRKIFVSLPILKIAQILKLFPQMSDTEKVALEAGHVWMDRELFSGKPNLKTLLSQPKPTLSVEEKEFLDGPVTRLCQSITDWDIIQNRRIPENTWKMMKELGFFGMIIPKKYGGLGFSALAHSEVVQKLGSYSPTLTITVMVPNSLGPAELLIHYGTKAQKDYYLPRLAIGKEMPCFALTEPTAGSDAASIKAEGRVFKDDKGKLCLRLNFEKRWITLAGISTVVGLAFKCVDPENLLGKGTSPGITCALIPSSTKGINIEKRHDPMGLPFYNCPIYGKDVVVGIDTIIGGQENAGEGWRMLMDCLSAGRGISLPASSTGGAKFALRQATAFAEVRKQFGISIGKLEGIEEPLARMAGLTYIMEASRRYTCSALNQHKKPAVITAIMKYHLTEFSRIVINDCMDILGGTAISKGPRNKITALYDAVPIQITVEGANILTRTMIIFGQGALRCHPYTYKELISAETGDISLFDQSFWGHIHHVFRNLCRYVLLGVTRGYLSLHLFGTLAPFKRRLLWASAAFAFLSDMIMFQYGGTLKRKEKITGRLADILSWMYLAVSVMHHYNAEGKKEEQIPILKWSLYHCFSEIQKAFEGLSNNLGIFYRLTLKYCLRWNPISELPSDQLGSAVSKMVQERAGLRDQLTQGIYIPSDRNDTLGRWENTFQKVLDTASLNKKIKQAVKEKKLPKRPVEDLIETALEKGILSSEEAKKISEAEILRLQTIQVDAFHESEYMNGST